MKHNMALPIALLLGVSLASSAFALDLGLSVGDQPLGPPQYLYYDVPVTCVLAGLTAEQSLGSVATVSASVYYSGGSVVEQVPLIVPPGIDERRTVANGLEGLVTASARMPLVEQRLTADVGFCAAYDLLRKRRDQEQLTSVTGFTEGIVVGARLRPARGMVVGADVVVPLLGQFSSKYLYETGNATFSVRDAGVLVPGLSLSLLFSL
jgi:hypothetical protein